jgi:hypothetical protein
MFSSVCHLSMAWMTPGFTPHACRAVQTKMRPECHVYSLTLSCPTSLDIAEYIAEVIRVPVLPLAHAASCFTRITAVLSLSGIWVFVGLSLTLLAFSRASLVSFLSS